MNSDWIDMPFPEAVAYLKGLRPMTRDEFDSMELDVRARAFTVARISKLEMIQGVLDEIDKGLTDGLTLAEFATSMDVIVDGALSDAHIETIYRTNVQTAYGAGKWQQGTDPAISDDIWGWRYVTVGDDRVRDEHEELEGMEFATGEGDAVFPPWDFNCRCSAEWITKTEAGDAAESDVLPDDVEEFLSTSDFASPALQIEYRPDLAGYHPSLLADYANDGALVN